jgi:protein-tyrosine-phosphatase
MAAAFAKQIGDKAVIVGSGGSNPSEKLNPAVVLAMKEVGIDLNFEKPKQWTTEDLDAADVIVTMGCGDACPVVAGKRYLDWEVPDPAGLPLEQVRSIRDEIEGRVVHLVDELLGGRG